MEFSFPQWYPLFKEVTIPSKIIPLSESFIKYLKSDGIYLPFSQPQESELSDDDDCDIISTESAAEFTTEIIDAAFTETHEKIQAVIKEYGSVFPKLNWSCPKDAIWIKCDNNLDCKRVEDIYMLMKASDRVAFDLSRETEFFLILRKWKMINPKEEFRCFVRDKRLIAICQRHLNNTCSYLLCEKEAYQEKILSFFNQEIKKFHSSECKYLLILDIFDVYFENRKPKLLDFNSFDENTDPLLFKPQELIHGSTEIEFRFLTDENDARLSFANQNRLPSDIINFQELYDQTKVLI